MPSFEVGVYNKDVRELVSTGQSHRHYTDDWAEIHLIEVKAADHGSALAKIRARYPENRGFVISGIQESDGF